MRFRAPAYKESYIDRWLVRPRTRDQLCARIYRISGDSNLPSRASDLFPARYARGNFSLFITSHNQLVAAAAGDDDDDSDDGDDGQVAPATKANVSIFQLADSASSSQSRLFLFLRLPPIETSPSYRFFFGTRRGFGNISPSKRGIGNVVVIIIIIVDCSFLLRGNSVFFEEERERRQFRIIIAENCLSPDARGLQFFDKKLSLPPLLSPPRLSRLYHLQWRALSIDFALYKLPHHVAPAKR